MLWLNFILGLNFIFFCLQNHTISPSPSPPPSPTDKKRFEERKFQPKIKLNSKKYICQLPFCRSYMSFLEYYAEKKGESDWWTISKKRFRKKLHKSDKRAGEILFDRFVVHAVFLKRGRAGGEKRRRCHTWPHEEVCYHFSWYILPTS